MSETTNSFIVSPSIFPFNEEIVIAKRGDSLTLPCWTTGYPSPLISWLKDGHPVTVIVDDFDLNEDSKNSKDIQFEGQHENLILKNIGLSTSGFYSCIASNEAGQDIFNYTIIVYGKRLFSIAFTFLIYLLFSLNI